jgi:hypothetical protein
MAVNLRNSIISSLNTGLRQSVTGGPTLWTPANLSGLSLWLDAADATTITESSGLVSQWDDKSGNGNHATQSTASDQPSYGTPTINTKNVINFASGKFMTTGYPPALNRTIATVVQYSSTSELKVIIGAREATDQRSYFGVNTGVVRIGVADEQASLNGTSGISVDTTYTQILKHGQGAVNKEVHHYLDGTEDVDDTFDGNIGSGQNYMIGGFNDQGTIHPSQYGGRMGETIITDNMMSDSDRQKLEGYLAHKWGHTGSLPEVHPYKSSAPVV